MRVLSNTSSRLRRLTSGVSSRVLAERRAVGKWPIVEIVAHLADAELTIGLRCRNLIATGSAAAEVQRLASHPGVERVCHDFGVAWYDDMAAQYSRLPPELLKLAGRHGCWVEIRTMQQCCRATWVLT